MAAKRRIPLLAAVALSTLVASVAGARSPEQRASKLEAKMTQGEKISLAVGGRSGVPRLGIPPLVVRDGPNGVGAGATNGTAFPNAEVVAASWDRSLAQSFGTALGAEAAGKGVSVLFAPTVNILRTWRWGRTAETLGEDPYLAGRLVASEIQGIQGAHVIAQVKHFAANNQEVDRFGYPLGNPPLSPAVDVVVSERALQEIYFPAFKAAVQDGGVGSVMCSYPRINGLYACENPAIISTLKNDWGFTGFVGPDSTLAIRDTVAAINAGIDNFALGGAGISPATALQQVSAERLDDMVHRILTAMFSVGLFDHSSTGGSDTVVSTPEHRTLARDIGIQGTVLLKNQDHVLPLSGIRSIAVIGHDAGPGTQRMEGGSATVVGGSVVTPLDAITARAGQGVTVIHAPGTLGVVPLPVLPADVLTPTSGSGPGLLGTYYASMDLSGSPVGSFVSPTLDSAHVLPAGAYSARWTGMLTPSATGTFRFSLAHAGIARLFIDGQLVASADSEGFDSAALGFPGVPLGSAHGLATLTAGIPVPITVEYSVGSSIQGAALHLGWQAPDAALAAAAVSAASAAEVAVVFASDFTGEGSDRTSLDLPGDQDALIGAVAAANPRTVVVLHTAGPVLMPWLSQVAAVIEAWYPGQETGNAIAAVLFGDADPSGRLAMTFPASADQGPGTQPTQYPGVGGEVHYDEGIFVGYRFYDRFGQEPLFPFGYGLSYTSFSLDRLRVQRRGNGQYAVSVRVRNTGTRLGAAVVQLYVGFPDSTGEPPNQLEGFGKVVLKPRRTKRVRMVLDPSSFASWSTAANAWTVEPGTYALRVGTSSRDLPLETMVAIR
jgi:beta-glucosidase